MTDHDFERRLRADLRKLAEPASAALRASVTAIPDEGPASVGRRLLPDSMPTVLRFAPLALAAAAVLVVVLVGIGQLVRPPDVGPPASAGAAPSQRANVPGDYGPIATGRTVYRPPWGFAYSMGNWIRGDLILTMPSGWDQLSTSRGAGMDGASTTLRAGVAGPVCAPADSEAEQSSGLSVDEFVAAITSAPALQATRADATLGGFDGSVVNLTVPRTFSCDGGNGWNTGALEGRSSFVEGFGMPWAPGSHHELWVLDVEGVTFVLDAGYDADATAAEREELRAIVESAEFELY